MAELGLEPRFCLSFDRCACALIHTPTEERVHARHCARRWGSRGGQASSFLVLTGGREMQVVQEAITQHKDEEKDRRGPYGNKAGRKAGDPARVLMSRERTSKGKSEKGVGKRGYRGI